MKRQYTNIRLVVYWFVTLGWSGLVLALLLRPRARSLTQDRSFDTFINTFFSYDFRVYNYFEGSVHVLLFVILTALWNLVLSRYVAQPLALRLTIIIALLVAFGTEIGQFFVNRGSLLFDLMANILGISLTSIWILSSKK